jgi:four helix bundle protein
MPFPAGVDSRLEPSRSFDHGQELRNRAFSFACHVVTFCQRVYDTGGVGRTMASQLVKSSTSVAGMLEEARAAESDRDFISNCSIALKACRESWMRLRVYEACRIGPPAECHALACEANELVSIVTTIVRKKRRNAEIKNRELGIRKN